MASKKVKLTTTMRHGDNDNDTDRLSLLPDDVLVKILSPLPIECLARTSVLSHRWRYLWTKTTSIELANHKLDLKPNTIHNILRQLTSPKIRVLDLTVDHKRGSNWETIVSLFFDHIRTRQVEVIKVYLKENEYDESYDSSYEPILDVPVWVFECQSLVVLELLVQYDINKLPDDRIISPNYPNLKTLKLVLGDNARCLLPAMFKSCPLLEDLDLMFEFKELKDHIIDISCPNLKYLIIYMVTFSLGRIVINAPKLLEIDIHDYISVYEIGQHPSELSAASITIDDEHDINDVPYQVDVMASKLIKAVNTASRLRLMNFGELLSYLNSMPEGFLPLFRNLVHLEMDIGKPIEWIDLLRFLRFFPKLEVLSVFTDSDASMNSIMEIMECLQNELPITIRKIKASGLLADECSVNLLKYILRKANRLEKLVVGVKIVDFTERQLPLETEFCKALFELPRTSSRCRIKVVGVSTYESMSAA